MFEKISRDIQFSVYVRIDKMDGDFPLEISLDNLEKIQILYNIDYPKHIAIFSTLKLLCKRLKKRPELSESFKLFALSKEWESDGEFFLIVSSSKILISSSSPASDFSFSLTMDKKTFSSIP
jgi:hypothetical protein